ncbi:MAG: MOSC N-terminal beta barrel domain-containing protein [Bryobacteraceae bacterium]
MNPVLREIRIYPIKSLDPVIVPSARVTAGGGLEHDRAWAIFDSTGKFINAKRNAALQKLRCEFDLAAKRVRFERGPEASLVTQLDALAEWLSDIVAEPVEIAHNPSGGFPDDKEASGPTIVSRASFDAVREWFPEMDAEGVRRRFRTNLEFDGVPAFWEECLYGAAGKPLRFRVNGVLFLGMNPCQRCAVPSRDPYSAAAMAGFQKTFAEKREATLPEWAQRSRFNHFYRFTVNTRIPGSEIGKVLRIGDELKFEPEGGE